MLNLELYFFYLLTYVYVKTGYQAKSINNRKVLKCQYYK